MINMIKEKFAQFSFKVLAKKAIVTGAQAATAVVIAQVPAIHAYAAAKAPFLLEAAGQVGISITLDPDRVQAALVLIFGGALEAGRNLAKRVGPAWLAGWL